MQKPRVSFKLVLLLVLAGVAVLFVMQNIAPVNVQFLFWSVRISLALLVLLLLAIGTLIGWLLHSLRRYRRTHRQESQ